MAYSGSIDLIAGLRPKNGGAFPLVNKEDVYVDDERRLSDVAEHFDKVATVMGIGTEPVQQVLRGLRKVEDVNNFVLHIENKKINPQVHEGRYHYRTFKVTEGETLYITGSAHDGSASAAKSFPVGGFYGADGRYLQNSKFGDAQGDVWTDHEITVPAGAVELAVNSVIQGQEIAAKHYVMLTGSDLIDGMKNNIEDMGIRMDDFLKEYDASNRATPGAQLNAATVVNDHLYDVARNTQDGTVRVGCGYSIYEVVGGAKYFVTCSSSWSTTSFPGGAFFNALGTQLGTFADEVQKGYEDLQVEAPAGAVTMVLNHNTGLEACIAKIGIEKQASSGAASGYSLDLADALAREMRKNPFALPETFDHGMVTFVFDDLLDDLASIASVFEEYGYKMGIAAIPDKIDNTEKYLTQTQGSYTPGMTMRAILKIITDDDHGGEVMTHSEEVITEKKQYNYEFMYKHCISGKKTLVDAGFAVRGLIRAGGTDEEGEEAVTRSAEIERWLVGSYEYSNQGITLPYNLDRVDICQDFDTIIKEKLNQCAQDKTWLRFMCHGYTYGGGVTFRNEEDVREILEHVKSLGLEVVTYANVIDRYGTTELEQRIKAIEQRLLGN